MPPVPLAAVQALKINVSDLILPSVIIGMIEFGTAKEILIFTI